MSFEFGPEVKLDRPAFVDPTARIFGRVSAGEGSSFWPYCVIRAEGAAVRIGRWCNIQDTAVIHVGGGRGTVIGDFCSIAHRAVVHGAEIGDDCLIGIGSVVMDGAKIGRRCVIGAMALVPPGTEIPEGSVVMGVPGRVVASRDNFIQTRRNALVYHTNPPPTPRAGMMDGVARSSWRGGRTSMRVWPPERKSRPKAGSPAAYRSCRCRA